MNIPQQKKDEQVTTWENLEKASFKDTKNKIERDKPNLDGCNCIVGLDMASLNDFACAGLLFNENGEHIWIHKTWICSNGRNFKDIKFPFHLAGEYGYTDFEVVNTNTISEDEVIRLGNGTNW